MINDQRKIVNLLSVCTMLLLEVLWGLVWLYTDVLRSLVPPSVNYDILYYISSVFLAFFSFIGLQFVFRGMLPYMQTSDSSKRETALELSALALFFVVGSAVFLWEKNVIYANDSYMPYHASKTIETVVLGASVLLLGIIWLLLRKTGWKKGKNRKLWPLYLILAVAAGYAVYQPNSFNTYFNQYHVHAYYGPVYRALRMQPFDGVNSGLYGFYGILLAPFIKLLGGNYKAFAAVMAALTVVSMLCYFYVLHHLTSRTWLKVLGGIGLIAPMTALWANIYLQTYPSRLLFPGFVLAWIVWKRKGRKINTKLEVAVSVVLLTLSLMWNLETGLGCILAFVGSELVSLFQSYSVREAILWKKAAKTLLYFPLAFVGAYCLVGLYNLIVSGKFISIKNFIFPYGSSFVDIQNIEMETFPSFWMLACVLIFTGIALVLLSTDLCGQRKRDVSMVFLSAATILCAVQMVYYTNRSVRSNLFLILPASVLMIVCLTEYFGKKDIWNKHSMGNGIGRAFVAGQTLVLVLVAIMACTVGISLEKERKKNRNMDSVYEWVTTIQNEIPANTPAIGMGTSELYSYLGWDTGFYGLDSWDFIYAQEEGQTFTYELLNQCERVLIDEDSLLRITECANGAIDPFYETHEVLCTYGFGSGTYNLYGRIAE